MVDWIIIDSDRRAKGLAAVGAPRKHHVSAVASAERYHTGKHVNVVVCAGTIHRHERLSAKSYPIDAALNEIATQVDNSVLVESWRDAWVLCIRRAEATKRRASSANKQIAVVVYLKRSGIGKICRADRTLPGHSTVEGTVECAEVASEELGPKLVQESVTRTASRVNGKPLFVASVSSAIG
jgi:hypothetical protein